MSVDFFIVSCPFGDAEFPVDPAKVPEGGIHARCNVCSGVFLVDVPRRHAVGTATALDVAPPEAPPAEASEGFDAYFEPVFSEEGLEAAAESVPDMEPGFGPAHLQVDPGAGTPAPEPPTVREEEIGIRMEVDIPASPAAGVVFGRRDPHDKAQRLARVLVSDMVTYHRDRHARSVAAGTLTEDFDEEIRKSWEEYVMQVGRALAEETTYFRDALNEILAGGQEIF
jgi:hypothetical protein